MSGQYHIPVLRDAAIDFLITVPEGVYVDGTLGGAGHAELIAERISPRGTLVGIDADADAHRVAETRLKRFAAHIVFVHDNNANIKSILQSLNLPAIHGLLLDLGVSSYQLDEGSKGFSYRSDDLLDMRMDRRRKLTATEVVNSYSEEDLAGIFWTYGEEKNSRRIARALVEHRSRHRIETSGVLAEIVSKYAPGGFPNKSLSRVFQALRIEVNDELASLSRTLNDATELLAAGGRIVVISYHSLEDRIVKEFFRTNAAASIPSGHKLIPDRPVVPRLKVLTKRPVTASADEQKLNPRSRSAKMRVAERT
ncbi:MAG TPA: 16S rRNA (cytosine(1402)-N(4))-methyltransferase RsmH [Bacteroidota bacterium]|nr:16S rRNA (cytosine(1402)-N(4))-methyltransferase RsmH [Bacteroidota bacterium]